MTHRPPRRWVALRAAAAALLVAGCHATADAPRVTTAPPAVRTAAIAPAAPAAPAAPTPDRAAALVQAEIEAGPPIIAPPRSAAETAPIEVARLPASAPPPPPSTLNDDPSRLMGLDGAALGALLGRPALRRVETPAEVWQYRGEKCVLDVYLYAPGTGAPHVVTYYEIRGGDDDATGRKRCLRGLLLAGGEG